MKVFPWFCIALAFILLIGGFYWTFFYELPSSPINKESWQEGALRGDFWGGHLSAITSFAGTLLFLAGLLFQTRELKLQHADINLSRQISIKQAEELEKQTKIAKHRAVISQVIELTNLNLTLITEIERLKIQLGSGKQPRPPKDHKQYIKKVENQIYGSIQGARKLLANEVLDDEEKEYLANLVDLDNKSYFT